MHMQYSSRLHTAGRLTSCCDSMSVSGCECRAYTADILRHLQQSPAWVRSLVWSQLQQIKYTVALAMTSMSFTTTHKMRHKAHAVDCQCICRAYTPECTQYYASQGSGKHMHNRRAAVHSTRQGGIATIRNSISILTRKSAGSVIGQK